MLFFSNSINSINGPNKNLFLHGGFRPGAESIATSANFPAARSKLLVNLISHLIPAFPFVIFHICTRFTHMTMLMICSTSIRLVFSKDAVIQEKL
jgi:hypothetical protein